MELLWSSPAYATSATKPQKNTMNPPAHQITDEAGLGFKIKKEKGTVPSALTCAKAHALSAPQSARAQLSAMLSTAVV